MPGQMCRPGSPVSRTHDVRMTLKQRSVRRDSQRAKESETGGTIVDEDGKDPPVRVGPDPKHRLARVRHRCRVVHHPRLECRAVEHGLEGFRVRVEGEGDEAAEAGGEEEHLVLVREHRPPAGGAPGQQRADGGADGGCARRKRRCGMGAGVWVG